MANAAALTGTTVHPPGLQEATDIYKRLLLEHREFLALNVYVALCYARLDYYDVSQVGPLGAAHHAPLVPWHLCVHGAAWPPVCLACMQQHLHTQGTSAAG
jgi:hypothetical protein